MKGYLSTLLVVGILLETTESAKILALFPYNAKSHFFMFETLLKNLATRGHEIVVLSHFPQKKPVPNYTDIDVGGTLPEIIDCMDFDLIQSEDYSTFPFTIWQEHVDMCKNVLSHENVKKFLESDHKFDLIIEEIFGSECSLGFVHKYKVPFIGVISSVAFTWSNSRIGNPDHPAYISNYFLPYTDRMPFGQRFFNTIYGMYLRWAYHKYSDIPTYAIAKEHFGDDLPPIWEIAKNTSLILVNSHFSINQPRPAVPGFIEVGGLHVTESSKLSSDLEKYIKESSHGVIYFSLGSMVRSETIPEDKLAALLDAFSELPQNILWRCNGEEIKNLPKNVVVSSWLPQRDILEHPNVVAFITHGGLMGTQEAVHCGVPMVTIPLFGDQFLNAENYVSKGIAVNLHYKDITKESVLKALTTVLTPQYKENAKKVSAHFRDRPQSALETAIFWTEYVIRHGGAKHMRSAAVDMSWCQFLLLDVISVISAISIIAAVIFYMILKKLINLVFSKKESSRISAKKKRS